MDFKTLVVMRTPNHGEPEATFCSIDVIVSEISWPSVALVTACTIPLVFENVGAVAQVTDSSFHDESTRTTVMFWVPVQLVPAT
jgi:hypothetical protein